MKNASPQDSSSFKQLSEFERDRIIELKEAGWVNRRIARHMGRSDAAIRICWQEWVDNRRCMHHDGSCQPRATADRKDGLIVRSAVTAPDSSLSTIRHANLTRVSTMTFHRRLIVDRYATCHSHLYTVEPDYSSAWLDQVEMMLAGDA
ncbi:HTH_Tnp_Tc3_2 domain-containing protein [Trichonephila clavipes]|nr:HTH_Tnp_Tc3_2 domain-containing protein [Trichonephila clavipes]